MKGLMKVKIEIEVKDKNGNVKERKVFQSKSWVKNWIYMLNACFKYGDATLKNTNGDDVVYKGSGIVFDARAGDGEDTKGIVVGSSDAEWDKEQYNLQSKINHGTAAGQLLYGSETISGAFDDPIEPYFRIVRTFTNDSGGAVIIREIGVIVRNAYDTTENLFLILRDVPESPITVNDGYAVTIRYVFSITY